jgi:hypothetical protein
MDESTAERPPLLDLARNEAYRAIATTQGNTLTRAAQIAVVAQAEASDRIATALERLAAVLEEAHA